MTPEEFADLIAAGNANQIAEATAGLSESQRTKLWKGISQAVKQLHSPLQYVAFASLQGAADSAGQQENRAAYERSMAAYEVATLAVGPLTHARNISTSWNAAIVEPLIKVFADRRPEWIDRWVEKRIDTRYGTRRDWNVVRALIRGGLCCKPNSDAYIRWMSTAALHEWHDDPHRSLRDVLAEDPEALEDVWRLFEVETEAFLTFESSQPREWPANWCTALAELAHDGFLDRQRLLDAPLKALSSGFKDSSLTYYLRFYRLLKPTPAESAARQQMFLDLLWNPATHVVTFVVQELGRIAKAGQLDGEAFLARMSPIFHLRTKVQAKKALQIVAQLVDREPKLVPHAVSGVLQAFTHSEIEVQQQAVALLEAWAPRLHSDHATSIREQLEYLAPTVRSRAEAVARRLRPAAAPAEPSAEADFAAKFAALEREAQTLPEPWRQRAGVNTALAALAAGRLPPPLTFSLMEARVLTGLAPIEPICSVDELIDVVAHAVESFDSADELERMLDGISRLGDRRTDDFAARTEPIARRLGDLHSQNGMRAPFTWFSLSDSLSQLTLAWICQSQPPKQHVPTALFKFFDARVQEVIQRVLVGQARPLLAAPTHQGGWIDAMVFVRRLREIYRCDDEPAPFDLLQALLRLAPDGREEALEAANDLPGHVGRVVRWCLGSGEGPQADDGSHTSLWLAAGRARFPTGALNELPLLKFSENSPDAFLPAHYVWRPHINETNDKPPWSPYFCRVEVEVEPAPPSDGVACTWPTVALHQRIENLTRCPAWQRGFARPTGMIAQVWPLCLDPLLVGGIYALGPRIDMPTSTLEPNHEFFQPWFEPDRPWSELTALVVWMGLVSKEAGSRTAALDALIQAIADGRACPQQMSAVLTRLLASEWLKLNRVAEALGEVARTSPEHAYFAAQTLQGSLAVLEKQPRDLHCLLALLHELLTDLGMALNPETRRRLEENPGAGKAKTLGAALKTLECRPLAATKRGEAALAMLEARIARARRWSIPPTNSSGGSRD